LSRALAAVVLVASLAVAVRYAWFMATTSLWNDEIYSVVLFSGPGPLVAVTDYHVPNNHVLFNLASSLLPGRGSVEPLRARGISFVAFFGTLAVGFLLLRPLAGAWVGAVFVALLALNRELLDVALQARGYGLTLLFSTLAALAVCRRSWALLAVASVLGTYAVPTFALFSASLFLAVLVFECGPSRPDRRRLLFAAIGAALGALLLYLPILRLLLTNAATYGDAWGESYRSWRAVAETFRLYVASPDLFGRPLPAVLAALALVALVFLAVRRGGPALALAVASLGFLTLCLVLRTPQIRTTLFVAPPLLVALLLSLPEPFNRSSVRLAVSALLVFTAVRLLERPRPLPLEDWTSVGRFIEETFPARIPVRAYWPVVCLKSYVSPERRVEMEIDAGAFSRGEAIALRNDPNRGLVFEGGAGSVGVHFPQRRWNEQIVVFHPPVDRHVTFAGGRFVLTPPGRYRSLVVARPARPPIVIPLGDRITTSVPWPGPVEAAGAWAYPSDP